MILYNKLKYFINKIKFIQQNLQLNHLTFSDEKQSLFILLSQISPSINYQYCEIYNTQNRITLNMYNDLSIQSQIIWPDYSLQNKFNQQKDDPTQKLNQLEDLQEAEYHNDFQNINELLNPKHQKNTNIQIKCNVFKRTSSQTLNDYTQQKVDQDIQKFFQSEVNSIQNNYQQIFSNDCKFKKRQSSKKYRDKKRDYMKFLEQQNKFLHKKVDQLSLRLNQTQKALNKLKYGDQNHTAQFQKMKQNCIKQIQQIVTVQGVSNNQLIEIQKRLQNLICFTGKQKINILNYFMSELLQNAVDDRSVYFLDCILEERGVYRLSKQTPLRKIDEEVLEILNAKQNLSGQSFFQKQISQCLINSAIRFKQIWQHIYFYYLKLLNKGFILQNFVQPFKQKIKSDLQISIPLKIQLFFQKIKYRADMRQLRKSWFKELDSENDLKKQLTMIQTSIEKHGKINS